MAGEVEGYISPSISFVKPAKTINYHDKLMPSNKKIGMESYLSDKMNEDILLNLLSSNDNKTKALDYLNDNLQKNHGILMLRDKLSLFEGFASALVDENDKIKSKCTKLISKIIPQLGGDLDDLMPQVLSRIISNVGSRIVSLQKESVQALYVYMKHSLDIYPILNSIAHDGMKHRDAHIRQQIIQSFPTLLFPDFNDEDFFDIVHCLVINLTESLVQKEIVLQVMEKLSNFLGKNVFNEYINRMSSPLQHTYLKCSTASIDKFIDMNAPNRIALHSKHTEETYEGGVNAEFSVADKQSNLFTKSDHFDNVPTRRRHDANKYSNISVESTSNSGNTFMNNKAKGYELSFIPKSILEQLSSSEPTVRLQAVEDFKDVMQSLKDTTLIKDNIMPLMSLLQLVFNDKNYRVACGALKIVSVVISKVEADLNKFLQLFVCFVSNRLGNVKDAVRSECYKVLFQIMGKVGHQRVLDFFWDKLTHKQFKVREDFICVVIATLLMCLKTCNYDNLDLNEICIQIANCLTDSQPVVRKAALDCIAVLGRIMGTTSREILSAVDKVELRHDNASGIMSAVQARLLKQHLPRLNENMLVEYAVFPSSTLRAGSLQSADVQWILAAEKNRKNNPSMSLHSSQNVVKQLYKKSIDNGSLESNLSQSSRRHASAGKHHFPWTSQEDLTNSKHPSSAPVNGAKVKNTRPPFQPKNTWGPGTEVASSGSSSSVNAAKGTKSLHGSVPSYLEQYNRRKEAQTNKSPGSSVSSGYSSNHTPSRKDYGYEPSFASNDVTASNVVTKTSSPLSQAVSALSNSCPSSFFENNPAARPRRIKSKVNQTKDSARSSVSSDDTMSPIRLKPALARSASKRGDVSVSASKDLLKTDDVTANMPLKLLDSVSPRFDRYNSSMEQMRPLVKPHNSVASGHEKFPGPTLDQFPPDHQSSPSPVGYTPTTLQRKFLKESNKPEQQSPRMFDIDATSVRSEPIFNDNLSSRYQNNPPAPRPILSSEFSPARHRNSEDLPENAVCSIRRSAQNKRERMRSQPSSEDGLNGSFTEFPRSPINVKTTTSSIVNDDNDFYTSPRFNEATSSPATEAPSFKYNPNTGKTFESKKVDSDVSVVGVGYHGQSYTGLSSNVISDVKMSQPAPNSPLLPASNSSSNITVLPSKYSPNATTPERNKTHRGSIQNITATSVSPDSSNHSFNIQGKGVFMTSSNNPSLSPNDVGITSKDDSTYKSAATEKVLDGVCGVAVRQPSLTPEDMSLPFRRLSTTQVSLSASLKERKERKEALTKNKLAKTLTYGETTTSTFPRSKPDSSYDYTQYRDTPGRFEHKIKSSKAPASVSSLSNRSTYNGMAGKSGSSTPLSLTPLDHPEKSLADAIHDLHNAHPEDWELMTEGMYTIRRLATHHPVVLSSRFHDVITLLNKYVSCLRSQVSKASVQAVTDVYTNLKKPVVDTDLDATIRVLLTEVGKTFIKSETNKALQAIVNVATASKTLNALLNTGLKHKNKNVRNTAAQFCAELVDKMGPGKALSGVKDTTDRLMEALGLFVTDQSEDVRYYGRLIVNKLMNHEDFNRCVDRYLSADNAKAVKNAANNIKQRGLSPLSSFGSRKSGGTVRRRAGSSPTSAPPDRPVAPSSSRSHTKVSKVFNEQRSSLQPYTSGALKSKESFRHPEHEKLKSICDDLSEGGLNERKDAILLLLDRIANDRKFVEENVVKIMSSYVTLLNTAQTKLNSIGLESLPDLIINLHSCFRDVTPQLVPALLKLVTSKQHGEMAQRNIDLLVKHVDASWVIPSFATSAMYSGNPKAKQTAVSTVTKLIDSVAHRKPQIIERQVLPVLWNFLSSQNAPSGVILRREIADLARALHSAFGRRLFDLAESQNLTQKLKNVLDS